MGFHSSALTRPPIPAEDVIDSVADLLRNAAHLIKTHHIKPSDSALYAIAVLNTVPTGTLNDPRIEAAIANLTSAHEGALAEESSRQ
ncbi:MAG: hypothetical protein H6922_01660 [Pseudomonadaceae bacterium]|nr:hypothetical protein [Pseudomonadaceae bacterium]